MYKCPICGMLIQPISFSRYQCNPILFRFYLYIAQFVVFLLSFVIFNYFITSQWDWYRKLKSTFQNNPILAFIIIFYFIISFPPLMAHISHKFDLGSFTIYERLAFIILLMLMIAIGMLSLLSVKLLFYLR